MKIQKIIVSGLASFMGLTAMAQWNADPNQNNDVSAPRSRVYVWDFGVNPDNSITTAFLSPQDGQIEMWYNIHDTEAKSIFEEGAQLVASDPTLLYTMFNSMAYHDSKGNMLMIYQNKRNATELGILGDCLNYDIYKVSPTGELLWDAPVDLNRGGSSEDAQGSLSVAELTDGSYIVAFCDYYYVEGQSMGRICIERISEDGEMLWNEPIYMEDKTISYTYPYLVNSTDNQVIMMYAKGTNQDLVMRKFDFEGTSVWPEDVVIYRGGFPAIPIWTFLSVIPDGKGGAIAGWRDDRFFTNLEKTYVSHVLSDGTYAYASGIDAEAVGYSEGLRSFEPTMLYDSENEYLYTIRRETSTSQGFQRLMIQKMTKSGELLWGSEGVELRPDDGCMVAFFDLQFAEDGNVVAFYMVQNGPNDVTGYAHKFNAQTGEAMWENDVRLTPDVAMRSEMKASPLIDGKYWIVMWEDERVLSTDDTTVDWTEMPVRLYMQRLNIDGTLGEPTSVESVEDDADIKVAGRSIIAPQGCEVYALDGVRSNAENLSPGIYIVRCGNKAKKVIIK